MARFTTAPRPAALRSKEPVEARSRHVAPAHFPEMRRYALIRVDGAVVILLWFVSAVSLRIRWRGRCYPDALHAPDEVQISASSRRGEFPWAIGKARSDISGFRCSLSSSHTRFTWLLRNQVPEDLSQAK